MFIADFITVDLNTLSSEVIVVKKKSLVKVY